MEVRACTAADLPAVQAIYAHHVLHGTGTFEEVPPTLDEMTARHARIVANARFPFLVAAEDGVILGFAYATEFRQRAAYRHTCESSVYIAPDAQRRGIGYALMREVIDRCTTQGLREMLAVIGDTQNYASIGLHAALGFAHVGTFHNVGHKFDRWIDVVLMQRSLQPGH